MNIIRKIKVPTGYINIAETKDGLIEFLSIGDYGKNHNLKADCLNITKDPGEVKHSNMLALEEKWVITISTQHGCSMNCTYCDVPLVGRGKNASLNTLCSQIIHGLKCFPDVRFSKRLNVHFARMGEPTWNPNVLDCAKWLKQHIDPEYKVHPVLTTMMPKRNEWLKTMIHTWMRMKNRLYHGNAGLQISINSTNENERNLMFHNNCCSLEEIARIVEGIIPVGRKMTLNFPVCQWEIDAKILSKYFDPDLFLVKLTPMHKTKTAENNEIKTEGDYCTYTPYKDIEESLKKEGYDVIVFITSPEEDDSRITCGNAILSLKDEEKVKTFENQWTQYEHHFGEIVDKKVNK